MQNCSSNINNQNVSSESMEAFLKHKQQYEDQVDYEFIQSVIQELTQSCAMPLPIPASAIPPLILQAAKFFWQNCDQAIEERYYCVPNNEFKRCCGNSTVKLPSQIVSVFGVHKTTQSFNFGVLGDFSLERMIMNNTALSGSVGGSMNNVFGQGSGYNLMDVTAALYEVSTYKAMFDTPLTYNYNEFSNELVILGALNNSNLVLQCFVRLKLQDLYKNYYFFRYVVALCLRSLATIMGTFEFKLPGGVTLNYSRFHDMGTQEIDEIKEWINKNHAPDYFMNSNSI